MVIPREAEIFYQDLCTKALVLVISTEAEIFYQDLCAKALVLVIPIEAEIFYQDLCAKALVLVIPIEAEIFYQDLHPKARESAQHPDWYHFTVIKIRWFLFAERLADASPERLSTVSSPYMVSYLFS